MAPTDHITSLLSRTHPSPTRQAPPTLKDLTAFFASHPDAPRTLIISCADPRCIPESIFHLDAGNPSDAAVVVRVQGADWVTAMPAVLSIDHLINFNNVILLKHTDCGSTVFRDANIKRKLKERAAKDVDHGVIDAMTFGENEISMQDSVRRDLKLIRESKLVSDGSVRNHPPHLTQRVRVGWVNNLRALGEVGDLGDHPVITG
ncbi:hypothetical protein DV736_g2813, partial [Chaetothyriales sp. CBS 134916]